MRPGAYSFAGLGTSCTDNCTANYQFWAVKAGYAFYPVLASNPTGSRASYVWDAPPSNWYVPNATAVTRAGANGMFADGSGAPNAVFTVFNFMSVTAGAQGPTDSTSGANFVAYDGSQGLVQLAASGQAVVYATGDDASSHAGVAWPSARLVDNHDGTVTDTLTGLVWLKDAGCLASAPWAGAIAAVNALASGQCGLTDGSTPGTWRMPNRKEMASLADRAQNNQADFFDWSWVSASSSIPSMSAVFTNFTAYEYYWTSTTDASATTKAWTVFSCDFGIYDTLKTNTGYTLAVRG